MIVEVAKRESGGYNCGALLFHERITHDVMRRLMPVMLLAVLLGFVPTGQAQAPNQPSVTVTGYVQDAFSGHSIVGAVVQVGESTTSTDGRGAVRPVEVILDGPVEDVDVLVTADGYQPWRFTGLTLTLGQPVELWVKLQQGAGAAPATQGTGPAEDIGSEPQLADLSADLVPFFMDPNTEIRIGRTYSNNCVVPSDAYSIPVQSMRFVDYVRNVLPKEWVASWPAASLDAGAVAVRQYAWYTAFIQRKWNRQYPFDLLDNPCDQYYVDNAAHPATDAAFNRTWWVTMNKNGNLFATFYRAHDYQCPRIPGCMGQHGSRNRALAGESAYEILLHYYSPAVLNLPGMEPQIYLPQVRR